MHWIASAQTVTMGDQVQRAVNFGGRNTSPPKPARSHCWLSVDGSNSCVALGALGQACPSHKGLATDSLQLNGRVDRLGSTSQHGPCTVGQPLPVISAALTGVLCRGAGIDCASGVHIGAGTLAAHAMRWPATKTSRNDNAATHRANRQCLEQQGFDRSDIAVRDAKSSTRQRLK
jgi:hypothetical protein